MTFASSIILGWSDVTVDLTWKAGHVAVAEAGDLAGPRGWRRASRTVKDKRTLVERGSESYRRGVECTSFFLFNIHIFIYMFLSLLSLFVSVNPGT